MLIRILLLLVIVPLLEMTVLLLLADVMGFLWTLVVVLAMGAVGAWLLRRNGLRAIGAIHDELSHGRLPTTELMDALLIMMAGIFLLTPGLLTDILGIAILLPVTRTWIRRWVVRWFQSRWRLQVGSPPSTQQASSQVIDSYVVAHQEESSD